MLLPPPFARIGLVISEPMRLPATLDKDGAARQAALLDEAMQRYARQAMDLIG
jgi:hypothetical protein